MQRRSPHIIACLALVCAFVSCGGGGGSDEQVASNVQRLAGRWVGTVQQNADTCVSTGPDAVSISGKTYTLDVYSVEFHAGLLAVDQDGVIYDGLDSEAEADGSIVASGLNYDSFSSPSGPTAIRMNTSDGSSGTFDFYIFYNRFCTTQLSGAFQRTGGTPSESPNYAELRGAWNGDLSLVSDECAIGVNPLRESHQVTSDSTNVTLVSTDKRVLNGHRQKVNSFVAEFSDSSNFDTVQYENISNGEANVTVSHFGSGGGCSTKWSGKMTLLR